MFTEVLAVISRYTYVFDDFRNSRFHFVPHGINALGCELRYRFVYHRAEFRIIHKILKVILQKTQQTKSNIYQDTNVYNSIAIPQFSSV